MHKYCNTVSGCSLNPHSWSFVVIVVVIVFITQVKFYFLIWASSILWSFIYAYYSTDMESNSTLGMAWVLLFAYTKLVPQYASDIQPPHRRRCFIYILETWIQVQNEMMTGCIWHYIALSSHMQCNTGSVRTKEISMWISLYSGLEVGIDAGRCCLLSSGTLHFEELSSDFWRHHNTCRQ